jgi:hypothetical protein
LNETLDWWLLPLEGTGKQKTGALPEFRARKLRPLSGQIQIVPLEWDGQGDRVLFAAGTGDAGNLWQTAISRGKIDSSELRRVTVGPGRQAHASVALVAGASRVAFADVILNYDIWTMPLDADRGAARADVAHHRYGFGGVGLFTDIGRNGHVVHQP